MNPGYFRLANGEIIKHYSELSDVFEKINDEEFFSHVNESKNDFSKWVYEVYGLSDLSTYLSMAKTRNEAKRVVNAYLRMAEVKFQFKTPVTNQKIVPEKKEEPKYNKIVSSMSDADRFFRENPVIVSQRVEAKKENLVFEPLVFPVLTGNESPEQLVSIFRDAYAKAYEKVVFLRKNGYDTKLIEVMLFRIPPKIKIYEASKENKDSELIKRYLNEVIDEINKVR